MTSLESAPWNSSLSTPPSNWSDVNITGCPVSNKSVPTFDYIIWVYFSPPLFILGVTGNVLAFLVMRRKMFQSTSTGIYMQLMAVMDTSFLVVGLFLDWLEWAKFITVSHLHPWVCKIYRFLFYTTGDAAIWIIVAFTFDRFVAVCFPLHKQTVCKRSRALIAFAILFSASAAKNAHVFWTRGASEFSPEGVACRPCGAIDPYVGFEIYIRPWFAFALVMATPFFLILLFNCLMIRSLVLAQRMRAHSSARVGAGAQQKGSTSYMQTTLMCLSVSFSFLVFIAPSMVLLIGKPYWTTKNSINREFEVAKVVNNMMVYVNHSINFLLYCLTGQRFRNELSVMFSKRKVPHDSGRRLTGAVTTQTGDATCGTPSVAGLSDKYKDSIISLDVTGSVGDHRRGSANGTGISGAGKNRRRSKTGIRLTGHKRLENDIEESMD